LLGGLVHVRTELQHRWAMLVERLTKLGQQFKYGQPPDDPECPADYG